MKPIFLFLILIFFNPSVALSKLAPTDLDDLIADSELIVMVEAIEAKKMKNRPLSTVVKVLKSYKGKASEEYIKIRFSPEVHEQTFGKNKEVRLLFLKKHNKEWRATHYGRSYWPLYPAKTNSGIEWATPLVYPTTMLKIDKKYHQKASFKNKLENSGLIWGKGAQYMLLPSQLVFSSAKQKSVVPNK